MGEKFHVGVRAPATNGTFRVYYAGVNEFGYFKFNDTVLASADIVDGIGVVELSIPKGGNPIYTVDHDTMDYWIEYSTTKGSGNLSFYTIFIKNNENISAQVSPMEFIEGGLNTVTLQFSAPIEGQLQYYLDGIGNYFEHDINVETKSANVQFEYLSVGKHDIRVFFLYGEGYDGVGKFSKTFTVNVLPRTPVIVPTATKITSSKVTTKYNVWTATACMRRAEQRVISAKRRTARSLKRACGPAFAPFPIFSIPKCGSGSAGSTNS